MGFLRVIVPALTLSFVSNRQASTTSSKSMWNPRNGTISFELHVNLAMLPPTLRAKNRDAIGDHNDFQFVAIGIEGFGGLGRATQDFITETTMLSTKRMHKCSYAWTLIETCTPPDPCCTER